MKHKERAPTDRLILLSMSVGIASVFLLVFHFGSRYVAGISSAKQGLVYEGIVLGTTDNSCEREFQVITSEGTICTHGPDPAPSGVDVRDKKLPEDMEVSYENGGSVQAESVACTGDGQSGNRVQLVYARASDRPDRYDLFQDSFQLWAQQLNRVISDSAAKTGGTSQIRFVHDSSCTPVIADLVLSNSGDDTFSRTINEMIAAGYDRDDRKYLVWMDANVYCGIASYWLDDRSGQNNMNNTSSSWSRVDNGCWGMNNSVEAHELLHMLGAVQTSAPNSDDEGHCTDEYDRLCYASVPGVTMRYVCAGSQERLLDCNDDDYFSTAPQPNSYLANHWNSANSSFLSTQFAPTSSGDDPVVYRMANWQTRERLYTTNFSEINYARQNYTGWVYEGVAMRAYSGPGSGKVPVYRMANWKTRERLFTTNLAEINYSISHYPGWINEGVAFYASSNSTATTVFRMANWKTKERLFTTNPAEVTYALQKYPGWINEGTAFYAP